MFNAIILTLILFAPQPPSIPDGLPSGPMPFALPSLPTVPHLQLPALVMPELEHSDSYSSDLATANATLDSWNAPLESLNNTLSDFTSSELMPAASGSDFTAGYAPIDNQSMTAYQFAENAGEKVGVLFTWARAITLFTSYGTGDFFLFMFACAALLALTKAMVFLLQFADAVISFSTRVAQTFADFFIPW